MKVNQ